MAILLFAGCGTTEESSVATRFPGTVDSITSVGNIKQVEYHDAKTGAAYQLRASLGDSGWIETVSKRDKAESVRIEWTPETVHVESSQPGGTSQFYFVGATRGIDKIKPGTVATQRHAGSVDRLPFLLDSATQADVVLATPSIAPALLVAHDLLAQGPSRPVIMAAAETFPCDSSLDISANCAVEAKMAKPNNQTVFDVSASWGRDKNTMYLRSGDNDGMVRIQACPPAAYDCTKPGNAGAKKEQALAATAATDDNDWRSNEACGILKGEGEGVDVGKKFEVKGLAEIRPGDKVRPKDPTDEAKHPDGAKLYWDLPRKTSRMYNSQFVQGHSKDTTERSSYEIPLTTAAMTGSLAIGGKSQIDVQVQTCQDIETGFQDDYAIKLTGTRTNALYECSGPSN